MLTYFVPLASFIPKRKCKSLAKSVKSVVLQKDSTFELAQFKSNIPKKPTRCTKPMVISNHYLFIYMLGCKDWICTGMQTDKLEEEPHPDLWADWFYSGERAGGESLSPAASEQLHCPGRLRGKALKQCQSQPGLKCNTKGKKQAARVGDSLPRGMEAPVLFAL